MIADAHDRRRQKREGWALFEAEAAYADSIFRSAIGRYRALHPRVGAGSRDLFGLCTRRYSLGSVEYQRNRKAKGRRLPLSLVSVVDDALTGRRSSKRQAICSSNKVNTPMVWSCNRAAVERFPDVGVFHQGRGCCAAHEGVSFARLVASSRRALAIGPDNQKFVNDLGWCLAQSGAPQEALATLAARRLLWTLPMSLRERIYGCAT